MRSVLVVTQVLQIQQAAQAQTRRSVRLSHTAVAAEGRAMQPATEVAAEVVVTPRLVLLLEATSEEALVGQTAVLVVMQVAPV